MELLAPNHSFQQAFHLVLLLHLQGGYRADTQADLKQESPRVQIRAIFLFTVWTPSMTH